VLNHTGVLFPVTFLNDQFHEVGVFVEVSVKPTSNGAVPLVTLALKLEIGAMVKAVTLMKVTCVEMLYPALLDAFNSME
jgi:hypothetical protein